MRVVSKMKLANAVYDYYKYMISAKQQIERRKLPREYREEQKKQDEEDLKEYLKSISMRKLSEKAKYSKQYFEKEYDKGNISDREYELILGNLEKLEKRVKDNMKVKAPKGTAKKYQEENVGASNKKRSIAGIAIGAICVAIIVSGGAYHYIDKKNKEEEKQEEQRRALEKAKLEDAKKVLEDKKYSVYELAKEAKAEENSSYLIDEVSKVFIDEFNNKTGRNIEDVTIVKQKILVGRNHEGKIVHATKNLKSYIDQGFSTGEENRYLIFNGEAIGEDGMFIEENFLGECTESGEFFTDSIALSKEASQELIDMIKMLRSSFSFKDSIMEGSSEDTLKNEISRYYELANEYYEKIGIKDKLKREAGNELITDENGNVITYVYEYESDEHKQEVEKAKEIIKQMQINERIDQQMKTPSADGWEL